jgi:hypothetical protein
VGRIGQDRLAIDRRDTALPLTVHECLLLGGTVGLHQWCGSGLKCTSESGSHAICIDTAVIRS